MATPGPAQGVLSVLQKLSCASCYGFMEKANETLFFMGIQEAVDWYHTGLKKEKFYKYLKQKNKRKKFF